jgi:hypothetical protein
MRAIALSFALALLSSAAADADSAFPPDGAGGPFDPNPVFDARSHIICPPSRDGIMRFVARANGDGFVCTYQRHIVELGHNVLRIQALPAKPDRTLDIVFKDEAAVTGSEPVYASPALDPASATDGPTKSAFYVGSYYGRSNTTAIYAGFRRGWYVVVSINFPGMPDRVEADPAEPYLAELGLKDRALAPQIFLAALDQVGR